MSSNVTHSPPTTPASRFHTGHRILPAPDACEWLMVDHHFDGQQVVGIDVERKALSCIDELRERRWARAASAAA